MRQDCITRWNSTFLMLRRSLRLRPAITRFVAEYDGRRQCSSLAMTDLEWRQAEYLAEITRPFFNLTLSLSQMTGPTVHAAFRIYNSLFDHLKSLTRCLRQKQARWKQDLTTSLDAAYRKLRKYYRRTYTGHGYLYAMATMLAPQMKQQEFKRQLWADDEIDWYEEYTTVFQKLYDHYAQQSASHVPVSRRQYTRDPVEKAIRQTERRSKKKLVQSREQSVSQHQLGDDHGSPSSAERDEIRMYMQEGKFSHSSSKAQSNSS